MLFVETNGGNHHSFIGALYGASVGASIGQRNAMDRAKKEELERLGITPDMLEMAQEVGMALERSMEGLQATKDSLETQQRLARRLDQDANELMEQAKVALQQSDEETARKRLEQRHWIMEKLKSVLKQCVDEKKRLERMEANVSALELRAKEVDVLLNRAVGAKNIKYANDLGMSLSEDDPLLQKFRDAGIE